MASNSLKVELPDYLNSDDYSEAFLYNNLTITKKDCVNPVLLGSFFRFLRRYSDDVIEQRVNDSITPKSSSKLVHCDNFIKSQLYPNWNIRDNVISYCSNYATSLKRELDTTCSENSESASPPVTETRIDPYAAIDYKNAKTMRYNDYNSVVNWVENQKEIEKILRKRSVNVLLNNCGQASYLDDFTKSYRNNIK
ncbi:related to Mic23p [Saccharomycodes ludwigii]|uniref:Related to Mic23p n=1 Tax=Saccharomycodes ludwigii TaxID=36035 RepID=A0A376B878_9ASCO|nr:hypothetical protein SCDLUD_000121 [Saccharomycodes ludwigii]KAH3902542.1 hypothetical protein SCDLUD_000121 [Saccharomycodes ludwigii]SSD60779.1 related to Mic23p [Saccharomycodes ludwigii]